MKGDSYTQGESILLLYSMVLILTFVFCCVIILV